MATSEQVFNSNTRQFYSKRFKYIYNSMILSQYINICLLLFQFLMIYFKIIDNIIVNFIFGIIIFINIISSHHLKMYSQNYEFELRTGRSIHSV